MSQSNIKNAISVIGSSLLSIAFVAILDTVFSIQDTSLKLTFVAFLSSTGAIGFCNVMNKTTQNKK